MQSKCLYCYQPINGVGDFHESCSKQFFGNSEPQPKLSLSIVKEITGNSKQRLTVVGALGGNYILKPPSLHYPEMPANEHLTMRIAEAFKIKVVPSSLIRLKSNELAYITKRIDRTPKGSKIHMIDMFQITEAFDKYKSSMEKLGKALKEYSDRTMLDVISLFELTLFCFLTGNNDMHLKNFSMIKSPSGWIFAPAYDLLNVAIANPDDKEELALTLAGKKKKITRHHFECFGSELGLTNKQTQGTFHRFEKNSAKAIELIHQSFLSDSMKQSYMELLEERYSRISANKVK
jgi:serine/threonine-protein kinase HipA